MNMTVKEINEQFDEIQTWPRDFERMNDAITKIMESLIEHLATPGVILAGHKEVIKLINKRYWETLKLMDWR